MTPPRSRESQDYGLGKCVCGEFAIVGLNGRGCCLACFEGGLKRIKEQIARLEERDAG